MEAGAVARRRMRNSALTGQPATSAVEVITQHLAMQAQDYGPAKWSISQRATNVSDPDIDDALADGSIVRTHVMRETWHFVGRDDIRWLLALTGPRILKGAAGRHRQLGLDARTLSRAERILQQALSGVELTRKELAEVFHRKRLDVAGQRLPHLLLHAELIGLICSGSRHGKHHSYALLDERVPESAAFDRDGSVVELTRRYLTSHGPATVEDLRWWSSLTTSDLREALDALGDEVRCREIDGADMWSMTSEPRRAPTPKGARLLHIYDEFAVGYTVSRYDGDPRAQQAREAWKLRGPSSPLLIDGMIAGHWRSRAGSKTTELHLYDELSNAAEEAVGAEVERLAAFSGRGTRLEKFRL